MPEVSSKKFAAVFARALRDSGRLTPGDVRALKAAQTGIKNVKERAAAESIMALLRNDKELDGFEVEPAKRALGVLIGVSEGPLPKDLEAALANAVPQANVSVKHYELTFDLGGKGPAFPARAVIALDAKAKADTVLEVNPDRLAISAVLADGKAVPFRVEAGRLHAFAKGARTLQVDYTVKPDDSVDESSFGLIRDKYTGRMWTMTWPYNTGALFPSSSNPADGSTSSVTVKVANGIEAVATGTKQKDGSFLTAAEAPAYGVALYTAPDFDISKSSKTKGGVEVSVFGNADRIPKANRDAYRETAKAALEFYSGWLGKFDYGPTLKLVEVKGGLGGMEHTAAVAIMMNAARDKDAAKETAAHETAHHWFGDNVRIKTWGDFWMSEGFTNYATYRYFRADEGEPKYFELLDGAKAELTDALAENPHALSAPAYTDVNEIFDSVPYQMGPWMLRMMEVELGTEAFDQLLRGWYQGHRQKAVSTEDFVAFAKKETGHDFAPFFATWNSISAVPAFQADVKVKAGGVDVTLAAENATPRGLKVPLVLEGVDGGSKTVMVTPGRPTHIDVDFPVTKVRWDPDRTVLATVHAQRT